MLKVKLSLLGLPITRVYCSLLFFLNEVGEVALATVRLGESQLTVQGRPPRVTVSVGGKGVEGGGSDVGWGCVW